MKIKVYDSSKKKKSKPKAQKDYIRIPTFCGTKKYIKAAIDVYFKEKDEVFFIIKQLVNGCILRKGSISVNFGTGNAALTGIAYGFGWQIITGLYSLIFKNNNDLVSVAFTADYENALIDYKVDLLFKIKLFYHFKLLLRGFKVYKRIKAKFI